LVFSPRAGTRFLLRRLYSGLHEDTAELGMPEFGLRRLNQKLAPEIDPVSERWRFR
jgi:hypothetical protein